MQMQTAPEELRIIAAEKITELDVRPILRAGGEPFQPIMKAIGETALDGALKLHATFNPTPLITLLGRQGWTHWVEMGSGDHWVIWFYRAQTSSDIQSKISQEIPEFKERLKVEGQDWILNVRGLLPPRPMELTIALLDRLPPGARIVQLNERVPGFLLPLLDQRKISYRILSDVPGDVRMEIGGS